MRGLLLAALTLLVAPAAMAVHYRGIKLSPDGTKLVLHTDRGGVLAPRTDKDQQGFAAPHISPGGHMAGWLELVPLQGNDGPIPGALVIFRNGKVLSRFHCGDSVTWAWAFANGGKAIACAQSTLHLPTGFEYNLRSVSDGRLLGQFSCGRRLAGDRSNRYAVGSWQNNGKVPAWVWPIAQDCPAR